MVTSLTGVKASFSALIAAIVKRFKKHRLVLAFRRHCSPMLHAVVRQVLVAFARVAHWVTVSALLVLAMVLVQAFQSLGWDSLPDGLGIGMAPWMPNITWPQFDAMCATFFPTIWFLPPLVVILGLCLRKKMWLAILVGVALSSNHWLNQYTEACDMSLSKASSAREKTTFSTLLSPFDFSRLRPSVSKFKNTATDEKKSSMVVLWEKMANRLNVFLLFLCLMVLLQSIGIGRQVNTLIKSSSKDRIEQCLYWALLKLPFVIAIYGLMTALAAWWLSFIKSGQSLVWFVSWLSSVWIGSLLFILPYMVWRIERKLTLLEKKVGVTINASASEDGGSNFTPFGQNRALLRIGLPFCALGLISGIGMWCGAYLFDLNQRSVVEVQAGQLSKRFQQYLYRLEMLAESTHAWHQARVGKVTPEEAYAYLDYMTHRQMAFDAVEFVSIRPRFQSVRFQPQHDTKKGLGYSEIVVALQWHYAGTPSMEPTNFDRRDIRQHIQWVYESRKGEVFYDSLSQVGNASLKYVVPTFSSRSDFEQQGSSFDNPLDHRSSPPLLGSFATLKGGGADAVVDGFLVFSLSLERLFEADFLSEFRFLNPQITAETDRRRKILYGGQYLNEGVFSPQVSNVQLFEQRWHISILPSPVYDLFSYKVFSVVYPLVWALLFGLVLAFIFKEKLLSLFERLRLLHYRHNLMKTGSSRDTGIASKLAQPVEPAANGWSGDIERPLQIFLRESARYLQNDHWLGRDKRFSHSEWRFEESGGLPSLKESKSSLLSLHLMAWQLMVKIRSLKERKKPLDLPK